MDTKKRINKTVDWIKNTVESAKLNGVVVGLSGGIDSALAAALMKKAFPNDSLGIIIPIKSNEVDKEDALKVANSLEIKHFIIDMTDQHSNILNMIVSQADFDKKNLRMSDANLRARLRMSCIYTFANLYNYMVVGTDNAAELYTGYFTKYGDGACDILPLASLRKSEVYEWAKILGIPDSVIKRKPSAGLWEGQTDESEMGTTYEMIDSLLQKKEIPEKDKIIIERMHERTEHKRRLPLKCPSFLE